MPDFIHFSYFAKNKLDNVLQDNIIKPLKGYLNSNHIIFISDILSDKIKFTRWETTENNISFHEDYQKVKYFTVKTIDNEIYFCFEEELNKFINAEKDSYIS